MGVLDDAQEAVDKVVRHGGTPSEIATAMAAKHAAYNAELRAARRFRKLEIYAHERVSSSVRSLFSRSPDASSARP